MTFPPFSHVPIPATCAGRPTTPDGLVIPFGNVQLADGGCDFRTHHNARWLACWEQRRCQVCGNRLTVPAVLLCGPRQLARLLFDEPPLHPECARYTSRACPMVAGQRSHYRTGPVLAHRSRGGTCPDPGCDCGGWVPTPGITADPGGGSAHEWFAVYVRSYSLADTPDGRMTGGICSPADVVRVRRVSRPGRPPGPWEPVPNWLDSYTPPELAHPTREDPAR